MDCKINEDILEKLKTGFILDTGQDFETQKQLDSC
jgi:hypothetical protein